LARPKGTPNKPKSADLDEWLAEFWAMSGEDRLVLLATLNGAHKTLCRESGAPSPGLPRERQAAFEELGGDVAEALNNNAASKEGL